jgi:hypothetical protein
MTMTVANEPTEREQAAFKAAFSAAFPRLAAWADPQQAQARAAAVGLTARRWAMWYAARAYNPAT